MQWTSVFFALFFVFFVVEPWHLYGTIYCWLFSYNAAKHARWDQLFLQRYQSHLFFVILMNSKFLFSLIEHCPRPRCRCFGLRLFLFGLLSVTRFNAVSCIAPLVKVVAINVPLAIWLSVISVLDCGCTIKFNRVYIDYTHKCLMFCTAVNVTHRPPRNVGI